MHKDQLFLLLLVLLLLLPHQSFSIATENNQCTTSCGEIANISYPFRLKGDPKVCGHPNYELACKNNRTVLDFYPGNYYVRYIDYANYTIRVVDAGLQEGNCSSLPLRSLSCTYFMYQDRLDLYSCREYKFYGRELSKTISIVKCLKAVDSQFYIDASSCLDGVELWNFRTTSRRLYAMVDANVSNVETACTIELMAMIPWWVDGNNLGSYAQIHEQMVNGFEMSWLPIAGKMYCKRHIDWHISKHQIQCGLKKRFFTYFYVLGSALAIIFFLCIVLFMTLKFILGAPCVMMFLICKWRRRHLSMDQNVEEFLQSNNNFMPIRYSYSNIKKITGGLKDKLGEGGYGSVFKGRLRSGRYVAVKILKKGKANGQDFINEVATIGRIHHVNVVELIGFCFEGSKQALVYDFMHNGSLDKHIFSRGQETSLDCNEVYNIALGVARGIEYLHRGCDMQILHFDIKPHNILLDRDFNPKISDFGLAKLCPTNYNTISMTVARGTLGYMAPELVYRNLGGVSYKADVYSFGKLLMEMASGRKNMDADVEHSSQIYFPIWVHDQLCEGLDVPMEKVSEEDRSTIKQMMIVAIWCIQLNPGDRPSMRKALEMLEGEVDDLRMPPKPLFYPAEWSTRDDGTWTSDGEVTRSTSSPSALTHDDSPLESSMSGITQA